MATSREPPSPPASAAVPSIAGLRSRRAGWSPLRRDPDRAHVPARKDTVRASRVAAALVTATLVTLTLPLGAHAQTASVEGTLTTVDSRAKGIVVILRRV